jgi:hypothetical protein
MHNKKYWVLQNQRKKVKGLQPMIKPWINLQACGPS